MRIAVRKKRLLESVFCYKLIYFEPFKDIREAIEREKEIKDMSREKKKDFRC